MESLNAHRDPATGIHPFIPSKGSYSLLLTYLLFLFELLIPSNKVKEKTVVVANHAGWSDIIWLYKRYSPIFIYPVERNLVVVRTFMQALKHCGSIPDAKYAISVDKLFSQCKQQNWVIYIEGTTTNNKAILSPVESQDALRNILVQVISFKYTSGGTMPIPVDWRNISLTRSTNLQIAQTKTLVPFDRAHEELAKIGRWKVVKFTQTDKTTFLKNKTAAELRQKSEIIKKAE